ncbi:Uncharacterized protein BM_BM17556 [Brugia malayi]|uniref:Uncharacterized protein n=1 Tax=Brugia malayi TaxID=6279 RepID=A0A4E9FJ72_BRUMA|nr:Uncharacterized protein BM_BM17556 [Brugia malayi]VIO94890.1 Uncharacterized protein BM_BM17556 [Brugia malayi]
MFYLVGIIISIRIWHLFPKRPIVKVHGGKNNEAINDFKALLA